MDCSYVSLAICWVDVSLSWGQGHRPMGVPRPQGPAVRGSLQDSGLRAESSGRQSGDSPRGTDASSPAGAGVCLRVPDTARLKEKTQMGMCAFCSRSFGTGEFFTVAYSVLIGIWAPCRALGPRDRGRVEVQHSQNGLGFRVCCVPSWFSGENSGMRAVLVLSGAQSPDVSVRNGRTLVFTLLRPWATAGLEGWPKQHVEIESLDLALQQRTGCV